MFFEQEPRRKNDALRFDEDASRKLAVDIEQREHRAIDLVLDVLIRPYA